MKYVKINSLNQFKRIVKNWSKKPLVIEIETDPNQQIQPRQSFRKVKGGFQPEPLQEWPPVMKRLKTKLIYFFKD